MKMSTEIGQKKDSSFQEKMNGFQRDLVRGLINACKGHDDKALEEESARLKEMKEELSDGVSLVSFRELRMLRIEICDFYEKDKKLSA